MGCFSVEQADGRCLCPYEPVDFPPPKKPEQELSHYYAPGVVGLPVIFSGIKMPGFCSRFACRSNFLPNLRRTRAANQRVGHFPLFSSSARKIPDLEFHSVRAICFRERPLFLSTLTAHMVGWFFMGPNFFPADKPDGA